MTELEPPLTDGPRNFRTFRIVLFAILGLVIVVMGYAVTFGPVHVAQLRAESSDGDRALPIGEGARITPPAKWVSEPLVRDLIVWPPLPPLKDWSVLIGGEPGWLMQSPDHVLRVEVSVVEQRGAEGFLSERASDLGATLTSEQEATPARSEVLASGFTVTHVADAEELRAVIDTGDNLVGLRATTVGDDELDAYLPAISQLLEGVRGA